MTGGRPPFFVLTGGPGAGKSTLLAALAAAGHATVPESGRAIIREQQAAGGSALPWTDPLAYARLMAAREEENHRRARERPGPVFFDRGLPDVAGYLRTVGRAVPPDLLAQVRALPYARRVFLAPHWPAIYARDAERRQSAAEAERTCAAMRQLYGELGYETLELPLAPVAARLAFVLEACRL